MNDPTHEPVTNRDSVLVVSESLKKMRNDLNRDDEREFASVFGVARHRSYG